MKQSSHSPWELHPFLWFIIIVVCRHGHRDSPLLFCHDWLYWLYLMAMKQHGCERPMDAILTFNKTCLVSLKDLGGYGQHKALLKEVESLDHTLKIIDTPVAGNQSLLSASQNRIINFRRAISSSPRGLLLRGVRRKHRLRCSVPGMLVAYRDTLPTLLPKFWWRVPASLAPPS